MNEPHPLIKNRWSPRAMSGEILSEKEFMPLFEAASLAPSSSNSQPWRFLITKAKTERFEQFLSLLFEGNRIWAKNASLLVLVISRLHFEKNDKFSKTHSFDTGAAWENLALQGCFQNLVIHGMAGFDYVKAKEIFSIPDIYQIEMAIAIGKPGDKNSLPEELKKVEYPKERKPLEELICFDSFAFE